MDRFLSLLIKCIIPLSQAIIQQTKSPRGVLCSLGTVVPDAAVGVAPDVAVGVCGFVTKHIFYDVSIARIVI